MALLFVQYILPFLVLVLLITAIALRIHWWGGPVFLFIIFFGILFGPSLIYALIADDSSGTLFLLSLIAALATVFMLWLKFYKFKK
jgi:hypothetical protein